MRTCIGPACERRVRLTCRRRGLPGGREDDEECIALRIDLHTPVRGEGFTQQAPVLAERHAVGIRPEFVQ